MESSRRLMLHISYSFREKEWMLLTDLLKTQSWVTITSEIFARNCNKVKCLAFVFQRSCDIF